MKELFEIGKRGLFAAQRANAAIGHNIANVNTDGYSRQRVVLSPLDMKKNGYSLGRGVAVTDIQRMRNQLLDEQIYRAENQLGGLERKSTVLQQLENVLIAGNGNDLDAAIDNFFNSLSELSNTPQDMNLRKIVLSEAETMIHKFRNVDTELSSIEDGVERSAKDNIRQINSLLQDLAQLNSSISHSYAKGTADHNSLDIQVQKLTELSKLVDIETGTDKNGALEISIGGIKVLSGDKAETLTSQVETRNNRFHVRLTNGKALELSDGELAANIELYEQTLPELRDDLDTLAASLVEEFNSVHQTGYALDGTTNIAFFDPTGTTAATIGFSTAIEDTPENIAASDTLNTTTGEADPGNNAVLLKLVALHDKKIAALDNQSLSFTSVSIISSPGIELNQVQTEAAAKKSEHTLLLNQQGSIAGVNLDEEVTNLIAFQNAYQASARVISAAQQMYDTLLTIV